MSFTPGENVGPYRVIEQLGQGGMATVYKAYHAALDRYVAIKVLHPAFKEDPNFIARFEREARIVAKLDHPNIISIFDFAEHNGMPYLVMRYVQGKTLKAVLRQGQFPNDRILAIMRPVTDALSYAHSQGILHRDIKPSNIMLANEGHIFLADFGLARLVQAGESTLSQDMLIGTPQYISPEQARGNVADARSDIYSLGVILFEMFTGRVPFSADTPYAVIHDHIFTPLPLPTTINPNLSEGVERVLLKTLAKDPGARFADASELMTALDLVISAPSPAAAVAPLIPATVTPTPAPTTPHAPVPPLPTSEVTPGAGASITPPAVLTGESLVPTARPKSRTSLPRWAIIAGIVAIVLFACVGIALVGRAVINQANRSSQSLSAAGTPEATRVKSTNTFGSSARATAQASQKALPHVQLGDWFAEQNDAASAYSEYERAMTLDREMPESFLHAAQLAISHNELDRADKYLKAGLKALPQNADIAVEIGNVLNLQNKTDEARQIFEKVLAAQPNNARAMAGTGDSLRLQNNPADATREYMRALVADPNCPEAHYGLGMLAKDKGALDEARRQFALVIGNPDALDSIKEQASKQLRGIK